MSDTQLAEIAADLVDDAAPAAGVGAGHLLDQAETFAPGLDDGGDPHGPPIREALARWGLAPLAVLFALNAVDELDRIAFSVLAPNIQKTFGLSDAGLSATGALGGVLTVVAAIPFAVLGDRRRRTLIAAVTGAIWSVFALATGLAQSTVHLLLARTGAGIAKASVDPVHSSLLADYYPVDVRGRVFAAHRAANPFAGVLGPIAVGAVASVIGGAAGWRWSFIVFPPLGIVAALAALRLREPERGRQEMGEGQRPPERERTPPIPLASGMRRLLAIRSLRYMFFGIGVLGFALFGTGTLISLYFEERWGVGEFGRGVVFTLMAVGPLAGLPLGGVVGDRLFRYNPAWPMFLVGVSIPAFGVFMACAVAMPQLWLVIVVLVVGQGAVQLGVAPFQQMVAAVAPPAMRSLAFGAVGIFTVFFGGFLGAVIYGAISDATSPQVSLSLLWIPAVAAGALIAYGARFVAGDIAMVADDIAESRLAEQRRRAPQQNLLEVRNLDFSYGAVPVLFGVELDVPDGEIVALLGTNGAGKSTLLRAVCGLDHPTRGSIRFDGHDITYLEAEQILGLGIAMMPGGRATFPTLSVEENLQVGVYRYRDDRARVRRDLAQVYDWFPRLHDRRHQLAATLSGGEQQMVAIGKAFLARPRLLCLDELSLGLAPVVIEQLLGIVREIHDQGTTIVIVEQSVNIALSLATTAVFMEKGTVRYSGPAQVLLDRPDLLRSVFLAGVDGRMGP